MFEQRTKDVVVRVEPEFLAEQSSPSDSRFIWAYTVEIDNQGAEDLTVTERFWQIADSRGQVQEVRGKGVVGAGKVQCEGCDRLGDVVVHPRGDAKLAVPAHRVGRHCDDRGVGSARAFQCPDPARCLEPIHLWHLAIHQDRIEV